MHKDTLHVSTHVRHHSRISARIFSYTPSPLINPSSPLNLSPLLVPLKPTPRILSDPLPATLTRQFSRGPTPHPGLTVHDELPVCRRPRDAEPILKVLFRQEERVRVGSDGDIDATGDAPGVAQLAGFARVDEEMGRGGGGRLRELLDLWWGRGAWLAFAMEDGRWA